MQLSNKPLQQMEFLCPDCGFINQVGSQVLNEKYREHQVKCQNCNHLLEVIVADGMHDNLNIVASSIHEGVPL